MYNIVDVHDRFDRKHCFQQYFSYIKTAADIEKKLKSYLHHREYDLNPLGIKNIQDMISNKKVIYDLNVDSRFDKFSGRNQLKKIDGLRIDFGVHA